MGSTPIDANGVSMKNYIEFGDCIQTSLRSHPILRCFLVNFDIEHIFSSSKVNTFLGYKFVEYGGTCYSIDMNFLLNKVYEYFGME